MRIFLTFCLSLSAALALHGQASPKAELAPRLHTTVPDYSVSNTDMVRALLDVASRNQIPMGIEWGKLRSGRKVNVSLRGANVADIIQAVVNTEPGHVLDVNGEMVHVSYGGSRTDATNFLNKRIPKFDAENEYVPIALAKLRNVAGTVISPPLVQPRGTFVHVPITDEQRVTIHLRDATIREILDILSLASDHKVWAVTFPADLGLTPSGFRRTRSLWNNTPIADEQQPVWDRFDWKQKLPPLDGPEGQARP